MHCNLEEEEDALDTKGYVQYNYDAGTSLLWYELTIKRIYYHIQQGNDKLQTNTLQKNAHDCL